MWYIVVGIEEMKTEVGGVVFIMAGQNGPTRPKSAGPQGKKGQRVGQTGFGGSAGFLIRLRVG